jgi:hypothetical protein
MNKWAVIHAYRALMRAGAVESWTCQDDETVLVSRLGVDEQPVLWCMTCGNSTVPTEKAYDLMLMQIREHDETFNSRP